VDGVGTDSTHLAGDLPERLLHALGTAYAVEGEIGRGGMATVYRAHDRKHDRRVALKVLAPDLALTLGPERFRREIRLAAGLQHPHILPVFDSGEAAGLLWFTMPLVAGESLRARLARECQLPVADAVEIARELALALDYAHRHGVVHRDVKPENVLLTEEGQTLLADFGVARAAPALMPGVGAALTGAGLSLGTPAYMSPEQGAGEPDVDGRSDQYALACVLYECLAGEPPFTGSTPQAVLAKRFAGPAPDVGVLRDGVAPGVRAALARALGRNPVDRYPTTAAFAAALAGASPSETPPRAPGAAAPTWRGRRRVAVAVALGLAALTFAAVAVLRRAPNGRPGAVAVAATNPPADSAPVGSRQLTFSGAADEPSFSPDGRQVAYVETQCEPTAGQACTAALRVQDVGSAQSAVLATAERVLHPFWTADGAWVLVLLQPQGGELGTYRVPRLGGAPRRLGPPALVAFSATGDTVLLAALPAPGAARFVRRVRAATGETLDSAPLARALTDLQGMLPSPDGRWLALRLEERLLLATPDGRLTDSLVFRNAGSLRWDPRGDALYAVVPGVNTNVRLVRVRVDGRRGRFAGGVETLLNLGPAASLPTAARSSTPAGRSRRRSGR
jgi:tRNA A-37 threonylcarbamoyl transferase component Bud32